MSKISDTIFEERKEMMVSPNGDSNPTLRSAHFLHPTVVTDRHDQSVQNVVAPCFHPSFKPSCYNSVNIEDLREKVTFQASQYGDNKAWKSWVDRLRSIHRSTWKKAGVFEALLSSTYKIQKQNEVFFGVVEKWCPETNTFAFPWGEATISLEDMLVLGGFSVLGDSVLLNFSSWTDDMKEAEKDLVQACSDIVGMTGRFPRLKSWLYYFDQISGSRKIEHEAFLYCWLSRYVFPCQDTYFANKHLFPLAILLARGKRIALAPAVLACLYRNLSALKSRMIRENDETVLTLYVPFHLVLVWIWERFPTFRPNPHPIQCCDQRPRLARWSNVKKKRVENIRLLVDSECEKFQWRPYTDSSTLNQGVYEDWAFRDSDLDAKLELLVRCIRVSELVGILDCIEQYLPHRVAMQFGFDQDIPADCVLRSNETNEIAWKSYIRPFQDTKLYIPSRLSESDVTMQYFAWWRGSMRVPDDTVFGVGKDQETLRRVPLVSRDAVLGVGEDDEQNLFESNLVAKQGDEEESMIRSEDKCRNVKIEVMSDVEEKTETDNQATDIAAVTGSQNNEEMCIDSTVETTRPLWRIQSQNSLFDGSVDANVHDHPLPDWRRVFNSFGDVKNLPPPPSFPHKYRRVEVEKSQNEAVVIKKRSEEEVGNGSVGHAASTQGCVGIGSAGNAASRHDCFDEISILELESRISKLEKMCNGLQSAKFTL